MSLAALGIPDSPMWQMQEIEAGFYLHQADSLPPQPQNAQEVWQMSPDFHGLAGLMELPALELAAEQPDPVTAALIKVMQDKLSAYQAKIAEKRSYKSKAMQAKDLSELTKAVDAAQRWLTMVSAY